MIELVSQTRCIECNLCVKMCPTNVFDAVPRQLRTSVKSALPVSVTAIDLGLSRPSLLIQRWKHAW